MAKTSRTRHGRFFDAKDYVYWASDRFLRGYWRNLMQGQPNHIEILAEKLTLRGILTDIAREYTTPLTIMRGMPSLTVKKGVVERFRDSEKEKLIVLAITDLDPAGMAIVQDLVVSFRRDFHVPREKFEVYKVALTLKQVRTRNLPPSMEAKKTSPTYRRFVEKYRMTDAYELEALAPAELIGLLRAAIEHEKVLIRERFDEQKEKEKADKEKVKRLRKKTEEFLSKAVDEESESI